MTTFKRMHARVRPWMVVLLVATVYLGAVLISSDGDPLTLVTPGTRYSEQDPAGTEGYDGQFAYYIARDPLGAAPLVDVPAYRYQRILLPLLAHLLVLGNASLLPFALVGINLLALTLGTWVVEQILIQYDVSRWYALTFGLFVGNLMAVRLSLNEPLAYALAAAGCWSALKGRTWQAALWLAAAALAKETTLLFTAGYALWLLANRGWKASIARTALAVFPFLTWQAILYLWLGSPGIGSGGAKATPFETIPFNGAVRIYTDTGNLRVFIAFALLLVPAVILPALWALVSSTRDLVTGKWQLAAFVLWVNAAIMPFVPFSTYREPLGILRFIVGLVLATIIYGAVNRNQRVLRYSTLWIVLSLFAVVSG